MGLENGKSVEVLLVGDDDLGRICLKVSVSLISSGISLLLNDTIGEQILVSALYPNFSQPN